MSFIDYFTSILARKKLLQLKKFSHLNGKEANTPFDPSIKLVMNNGRVMA